MTRDGRTKGEARDAPLKVAIPKPLPEVFLDTVREWEVSQDDEIDEQDLQAAADAQAADLARAVRPPPPCALLHCCMDQQGDAAVRTRVLGARN